MPKKGCALGIESAGQKIECDASAVCAQRFRIAQTGERMIIGNEVKRFALGLERDGRLYHAKIIADVQRTAWLNTGQNAHVLVVCHVERGRDISSSLHRLSTGSDVQRFLDFARNDKLMCRARLAEYRTKCT